MRLADRYPRMNRPGGGTPASTPPAWEADCPTHKSRPEGGERRFSPPAAGRLAGERRLSRARHVTNRHGDSIVNRPVFTARALAAIGAAGCASNGQPAVAAVSVISVYPLRCGAEAAIRIGIASAMAPRPGRSDALRAVTNGPQLTRTVGLGRMPGPGTGDPEQGVSRKDRCGCPGRQRGGG
jgi:hypothetical protein